MIGDLDPVIHVPKWLAAMAMLANAPSVSFRFLKEQLSLGDSDLSKQMSVLEVAGYVKSTKDGHGRGASTIFTMTRAKGVRRALCGVARPDRPRLDSAGLGRTVAGMIRIPGLELTDHTFAVPLDHSQATGPTIEVFAREVVAAGRAKEDLPWLVYLQGGPGGKSPRPTAPDQWLGQAIKTHRVLLLDQRGTGRSTPVTARTVRGMESTALVAYLRNFRADSIVADAELIRGRLAGGARWETLGQSYGGFVTLTYLSRAPQGLRTCYVTGGLPGITATVDDVYARTYPRVAAKNAAYYRRYPDDIAAVRRIADHLDATDVRLPDGDRLTVRRLRLLGNAFGMSDGFENVHWLLEEAWHGDELADGFRHGVMGSTGFVDMPIFTLQEFCYGGPGRPTRWSAERAIADHPQFAPDANPLLFTGEMMYRWMFDDIAALRPFAGAADLLADAEDWPELYDPAVLARNEVPVHAAVYFDDMYVDADLQLRTAAQVGNVRTWVTNEYEHNGLRASGGRVLARLMDMAAGRA